MATGWLPNCSSSTSRPVVVILTGVTEPKLAKDLIARGVDDIVFKPIDQGTLAAKVRSLIARREASAMPTTSPDPSPWDRMPVRQCPRRKARHLSCAGSKSPGVQYSASWFHLLLGRSGARCPLRLIGSSSAGSGRASIPRHDRSRCCHLATSARGRQAAGSCDIRLKSGGIPQRHALMSPPKPCSVCKAVNGF